MHFFLKNVIDYKKQNFNNTFEVGKMIARTYFITPKSFKVIIHLV